MISLYFCCFLVIIDEKLGVCHCGPGFEPVDDGTCVDVDECLIENNCPDSSQGVATG